MATNNDNRNANNSTHSTGDTGDGTRRPVSSIGLVMSGGTAGIISRTVTAPVDRVRILYQVNSNRTFTIQNAAKSLKTIHKNTGIVGLWRGNGAAVLRTAPYQGAAFASFDIYKKYLEKNTNLDSNIAIRFTAGGLAGATATTLTYPLDLVRARMAAHWSMTPRYNGMVSGVREVIQKEGYLALYSGLHPTLLGIIPYAGISFGVFETLKSSCQTWLNLDSPIDIPTPIRLACGASAGLIAQTTTYPLHVVRRRMQVHETNPQTGEKLYAINVKTFNFTSVWSTLKHIYTTEGAAGLFKGVTLTYVKAPIAVALSFTINDKIKQYLSESSMVKDDIDRTLAPQIREPIMPQEVRLGSITNDEAMTESRTNAKEKGQLTFLEKFVAGGTAGACAKTMIAPADRVKIIYQVKPELKFTFPHAISTAKQIIETKGIVGLWRGHTATLARVFPYAAITFTSYEHYEHFLASEEVFGDSSMVSRFFAGAAAGATAHTFTYPLDLMRARLAADFGPTPVYDGYYSMFRTIVKTEGYAALFNGIKPTLFGIIPYAGMSFAMFETLKTQYRLWVADEDANGIPIDIPVLIRLGLGGVSALVAQSATYPLDIVRRRMQVDVVQRYKSMYHCWISISQREGWKSLYKGLSMNWLKGPIGVAVSFSVNDVVKAHLRERNEHEAVF